MMDIYEKIVSCTEAVRKKTGFQPHSALVLGSGLGEFARLAEIDEVVEYREIPGFPVSTVPGHQGRFLFGTLAGEPIVIMQGRVHFYEGYPMADVVLPIRVMKLLGAQRLFLTNAAGGVNPAFSAGDLMLLTGHISSLVPSPLIGPNLEELGPRFPDMTSVYSPELCRRALDAAAELGVTLRQGVYLQTTGPNYETPAEIRMYSSWGVDAVGMSTACEAMAARHMGMEICGVSCITNMAAGLGNRELSHQEVQETAAKAADVFQKLLVKLIGK